MKRNSAAANAAQDDHDLQGLYQRLAREQELFEQLATAKRMLDTATRQADRSRISLTEDGSRLLDRLRALRDDSNRLSLPALRLDCGDRFAPLRMRGHEGEENLRTQTVELNEAVARLRQKAVDDARRVEDIKGEIDRLEKVEIPACKGETTVGDVIAHRARVAAAEQRVQEIRALIETQEAFIATLKFEDLEQYDAMMEGLRAELVMGGLPDEDFVQREAEIIAKRDAAKQANDQLQQNASIARSTIAGLQGRQREAAEELDALQALTERVLAHFLRSEMEKLGAEYVQSAIKLRDLFIRAVGLQGIAESHQGTGDLLPEGWRDGFSLPALRVRACEGREHPHCRGLLFSARAGDGNSLWPASVEAEKARLQVLGVAI